MLSTVFQYWFDASSTVACEVVMSLLCTVCRHAARSRHETNASWSDDGVLRQWCTTADASKAANDAVIRCALLTANMFTLH